MLMPVWGLKVRAAESGGLRVAQDSNSGLPLIKLMDGFTYRSFAWRGEKLVDGNPIPARHDGMAVVAGPSASSEILLRNHENWVGPLITGEDVPVYDPMAISPGEVEDFPDGFACGGGVSETLLDQGQVVNSKALLGGTVANCAGGPTPWGTWLTCEETVIRGDRFTFAGTQLKDHGYIFEVPPSHLGKASAVPMKHFGLMKHEAAAVDPATGIVYHTEDNGPNSGFYRLIPTDVSGKLGSLEQGGKLQMLKVKNQANVDLTKTRIGQVFDVEWVDIDEPDSDSASDRVLSESTLFVLPGKSGPYLQGEKLGAANFARCEGCWYAMGRIYFVDTSGGPGGSGSIWIYDDNSARLLNYFAAESEEHADAIDNVTVHAKSAMVVACEDGAGRQDSDGTHINGTRLLVVKPQGERVILAENNIQLTSGLENNNAIQPGDYRSSEWCGATFSLDGTTLYANIQTPGITFAIQGPWHFI